MAFKFFYLLCLQIVFKFDKTAVLRGNKQKMSEIQYVETRWALGRRGFFFSHWLETRREMHPLGFQSSLGISQRFASTL